MFVCLCVLFMCTRVRVYAWHTSQLTHARVCVRFIRDRFDLRQLLAALHRYCRRQQLGQLTEKDEMKGGWGGGEESRWRERKMES